MNPFGAVEATPLQHALAGFTTALDHLVKVVDDGGLEDLDAHGLVWFAQAFETVRNRMPVVDHVLIRSGTDRDVPHTLCQRNMGRVLTEALRLSPAEAGRRVRAAEHLGPRQSMTAGPLPPWRPHLAEAQRRGEVSSEQVAVIDSALRQVDGRGFDPADVDAGEQILTEAAASLKPADLRDVAQKVVDAIDPDGSLPNEEIQRERRFFHFRKSADGSYRGEFRLTPETGEKLRAILDPLAGPKATSFHVGTQAATDPSDGNVTAAGDSDAGAARAGASGAGAARAGASGAGASGAGASGADESSADGGAVRGRRVVEPDSRTRGQRMHDALDAVCDRLLRAAVLPDSGGTPATVIITIDAGDLQARTGYGFCSDGSPMPASTVVDLADQADLAWCVKNSHGAVLAMGRSRRLASRNQTLALIARDGGCSFPGCDTPAEWSERHHIVPWVDGGKTDLDNLTLVCTYHHANFAGRGWTCRLNADRLPEWIPPAWIDRERRPIVHPRIRVRNWKPSWPLPDPDPPWGSAPS